MYIYYFKYKYLTLANTRYKEFRSVKWTEEKLVETVCLFPCRGRQHRSVTSAFRTKGYGTPLIDAVCEILHAPKRFFGDVYPSTP